MIPFFGQLSSLLLVYFGPPGAVEMIWPLWVAAGIQLSPVSFELEQGTSCMQLLPAALLMTQAAGPADVFCVQLTGRSVMFSVSQQQDYKEEFY